MLPIWRSHENSRKSARKNRYRTHRDIGFRVQFNAEFSRQVMNFPIIF